MGILIAHFHFDVSGLWVDQALLGQRYDLEFEGHRAFIQVPGHERDFELDRYTGTEHIYLIAGGTQSTPGRWSTAKIVMLRVGIQIPIDFTIPSGSIDNAILGKAIEVVKEPANVARRIAKSYLDLASIEGGQHWLGTKAHSPEITWLTHVYDEDGVRVNISVGDPMGIKIFSGAHAALTAPLQKRLLQLTAEGVQPPLAESFLRDAMYLRLEGSDAAQTLLYAAIACELKVKSTLIDLAGPDQRALVDLMIGKSREFTQAVAALFDKGCMAVGGSSMREDNRKLFKALTELFQDRNVIAHRGQSPDMARVRTHVSTAQSAFEWLDGLGLKKPELSRRTRLRIRNSSSLTKQSGRR